MLHFVVHSISVCNEVTPSFLFYTHFLSLLPSPLSAPSMFGKRPGIESFFYKGFFLPKGKEVSSHDESLEPWSVPLAVMFVILELNSLSDGCAVEVTTDG